MTVNTVKGIVTATYTQIWCDTWILLAEMSTKSVEKKVYTYVINESGPST